MEAAQEVVVFQDASSRDKVNDNINGVLGFMRWALLGLSVKAGDKITLVVVLHQLQTPSSDFVVGYKSRVDSFSLFGANPRIIKSEVSRIWKEYQKHADLVEISQLFQRQKVEFKIEVATGPSFRLVAVEAAKTLNATWVILDRQMKNDKKYMLKKLGCGISRIKRNNKIEQWRAPNKAKTSLERSRLSTETSTSHSSTTTYQDISSEDLFSIEL